MSALPRKADILFGGEKRSAMCQKQNFLRGPSVDPTACGPNMRIGAESKPRRRGASTALRYSAAAGDTTLGEVTEWDPTFAEPFAPGALISASGLSERRDFPSK
jgi:hypothetical protein